ncbi:hypothetical protein QBC38DRAFT_208399 [Podospora fimiseda]|uniref:Uncharacterized protein n=1 Tax=Podospora fimiseda TaxID=252190 RepID=A0AAN7BP85_9PEZI|nr:hypothetical protein QBC38DRAFT_208399 [Podospora fimiseda]
MKGGDGVFFTHNSGCGWMDGWVKGREGKGFLFSSFQPWVFSVSVGFILLSWSLRCGLAFDFFFFFSLLYQIMAFIVLFCVFVFSYYKVRQNIEQQSRRNKIFVFLIFSPTMLEEIKDGEAEENMSMKAT